MNEAQIARMAAWKLTNQLSCSKCKYLYFHDRGYSNYTVEETEVHCALDRNPRLIPAPNLPFDWMISEEDNWPLTNNSRCEMYEKAENPAHFDVEGDNQLLRSEFAELDAEAKAAISKHSGRT